MKKLSIILALLTFLGITTQTSAVVITEPSIAIMMCDNNIGDPQPKG